MSSRVDVADAREAVRAMARGIYAAEGCGVCEKPGADVFWFNPFSRFAHFVCFSKMDTIEKDLMATIDSAFKETRDRNKAHIAAVRAVRKELGGVSIQTFLDANGAEKLKSIFDSVGAPAARTYSSKD